MVGLELAFKSAPPCCPPMSSSGLDGSESDAAGPGHVFIAGCDEVRHTLLRAVLHVREVDVSLAFDNLRGIRQIDLGSHRSLDMPFADRMWILPVFACGTDLNLSVAALALLPSRLQWYPISAVG